jgi:palmitoyltransferase
MLFVIIIVISFGILYLIFCVPSNEYTFLGRIKIQIKSGLEQFLNLFPSPIKNIILSAYNYLVYKPNPSVQIFYLILVITLFLIYYFLGIKIYFPHKKISYNYVYTLYTLVFLCLYIFYLCSITNPGIIKSNNITNLKKKYPYDFLFNTEEKFCKKCNFEKINRSKHCIICDKCIEKFDHHCVWINNCVGAKNLKYFYYFIFMHWVLVTYASVLSCAIFYYEIKDKKLFDQIFYDVKTGQKYKADYKTVFRYLLWNNYSLIASTLMLIFMSVFLIFFLYFQFKLLINGYTSNEKNRQERRIKYMELIKETLEKIAKEKKIELKDMKLNSKEIKKYKQIAFKEIDTDLEGLNEKQINEFYNFTKESIFSYQINPYRKNTLFMKILNKIIY